MTQMKKDYVTISMEEDFLLVQRNEEIVKVQGRAAEIIENLTYDGAESFIPMEDEVWEELKEMCAELSAQPKTGEP